MRFVVAIVSMLAALACLPGLAQAKPTRGFTGVTVDRDAGQAPPATQAEQFGRMAQSGVESARVIFRWSAAQPTEGGPFSFAATDPIVAEAARRRIDLLPILIYAPPWARLKPGRSASPPRSSAEYGRFVAALVDRYGPRGSFWRANPGIPKRPVRAWQIWNEPHLVYQWDTGATSNETLRWSGRYVSVLRSARRAIRNRDRGGKVVLAGLTGESWKALAKIYRAGGRGLFDVVGVHPYTKVPRGVITITERVRRTMRRARDARTSIWLTEVSWPAARGRIRMSADERRLVTDDAGMARRLTAAFKLVARERKRLRIGRLYWYTWASAYGNDGLFDFSGLNSYRAGGRFEAKPALRAYTRAARRLQGCAKTSVGTCKR